MSGLTVGKSRISVTSVEQLIHVVVDGVGVPGGHGGRVCCCRDGCGSVGRFIGPLVVATKSFGI